MITSRPLEPFGAEVALDAGAPLAPTDQAELRRLYHEHDLLVVRGQRLTLDDQIRLMGCLGPVLHTSDGIGQIRPDNGLRTAALAFHSDLAFSPEPVLGISLCALDVVDDRTATRFASARRAYQALDPEQQRSLEGRDALHVFAVDLGGRNRASEVVAGLPRSTHPVVLHHPVTGRPLLFVCENQTDSVVGLDADESEELLATLFAVLYEPANVLEHRWRNGDLVVWDNLAVQHGRGDISHDGPRVLQRVALGTRGLVEQHPELADYYR